MSDKFEIRLADWQNPFDQAALKQIRTSVFIDEQNVPPLLEWDEHDKTAIHLLASDCYGQPIACARLLIRSKLNQATHNSGKIGRMAVLLSWRRNGVGAALMHAATDYCYAHDIEDISLSAQTHAIGFYQKVGFVVSSQPYLDAGITHVDMQLVI